MYISHVYADIQKWEKAKKRTHPIQHHVPVRITRSINVINCFINLKFKIFQTSLKHPSLHIWASIIFLFLHISFWCTVRAKQHCSRRHRRIITLSIHASNISRLTLRSSQYNFIAFWVQILIYSCIYYYVTPMHFSIKLYILFFAYYTVHISHAYSYALACVHTLILCTCKKVLFFFLQFIHIHIFAKRRIAP